MGVVSTRGARLVTLAASPYLQHMMTREYSWVFNAPVDAVKLGLHDYHQVVPHPMDLGTVRAKLTRLEYPTLSAFARDVELTFTNSIAYNEEGSEVWSLAVQMLETFGRLWSEVQGALR
jgi:hypothetical protein